MKKFIKEMCETIVVLAGMYCMFQLGNIWGMTKAEKEVKTYDVESYSASDGYTKPSYYKTEVTTYESGLEMIRDFDSDGKGLAWTWKYDNKCIDVTLLYKICEELI